LPNNLSNTTRGLFSLGSGVVGEVQVDAAVGAVAHPAKHAQVDGQLERRNHRLSAELTSGDLVRRHAVLEVGAFRSLRAHAREPRRRALGVIARRILRVRLGHALRQAAEHGESVTERREGSEDLRHFEGLAGPFRRPEVDAREVLGDPVRHVDKSEPLGLRRLRRKGGRHRIEER
jgi:hypothetical protein